SPAFYQLLDSHLPNWQALKKQLDDLSALLLNE
ncbi:MAG: M48 family metallopeptidase, partial [Algicola sp.]|nr:M48 family metallopeptidase [Algicola sp.]